MIDGTTGFLSRISREIHDVCQTDRQRDRKRESMGKVVMDRCKHHSLF